MRPEPHGTHPERTTLAVHRTAAAILVVALALVRLGATRGPGFTVVVAATASALALGSMILARVAYRNETPHVPFPRAAATAALAVCLVSIAGLTATLP